MIEQLFSLIQQESQKEIINNPAIPNEQNGLAVGLATESIFGGLQNVLANGGLEQVMGLFGNNQENAGVRQDNPLVGGIVQNLVGQFMTRLGLSQQSANGIASVLIPMVLNKLVGKTTSTDNNGFDINGLLGSLLGGKSNHGNAVELPNRSNGIDFGGLLSKVSQGGGLDIDGDGDVDLQDIIAATSGAATNVQRNRQSSGMMDLIGGLLGG
jgi:hypothetical protein